MRQVFVDHLSPDQIRRVEQRMLASGFLAPDETLAGVVAGDLRTLDELRLTPDEIADRLDYVIGRACQTLGTDLFGEGLPREYRDYLVCATCGWERAVGEGLPSRGWPCPRCGGRLSARRTPLRPRLTVDGQWGVGGYEVVVKGHQDCPFEDPAGTRCDWYAEPTPWTHPAQDLHITRLATGTILEVPRLTIHLIRVHHFFEGQVPYRIDPRQAAEVLALVGDATEMR